MKNIQDHLIFEGASILTALEQLNRLPRTLTLFAINRKKQLVGTLTDGDIRRGFLNGRSLDEKVKDFLPDAFHYIKENGINVQEIKAQKGKGIRLLPVLNDKCEIVEVYDLFHLNSVLPVDAVIMAGGQGKRLRPLTDTIPKPMIRLGEKPILEHNIDRLITFGIRNIYISVNYLKEQIMDYFGDGTYKGVNILYIEEEKPLGTAGALSLIDTFGHDVLLTNSDLFTNINYEDLYLSFHNNQADIAIASVPYTVNIPYAILEEKENFITNFKEKPSNTHYANAGIYIIKKDMLSNLPKNKFFNMTDLMQNAIDSQKRIVHNPIIGYWIDIGNHEDLKRAQVIMEHNNQKIYG